VKGITKRISGALFLLLAVAVGARIVYALLLPLLPLLVFGVVLVLVYAVALGFLRRL
jgi:hypothetical protein